MDGLRTLEKSDDRTIKLCWSLLKSDQSNMNLIQYIASSAIDIQVFLHKNSKDRVQMVKPFLENRKIDVIDSMVLTCLTKLLPTRIETPFLISYFINRLTPERITTKEQIVDQKMKLLEDIELIKQVKELANVENLTEEYIETAIVHDASKRFMNQIDFKINDYMKQFMGEQRDSWLNRINEVNAKKNHFKKLSQKALKTIAMNTNTKIFCSMLIRHWWNMEKQLSKLLKHCFVYGNRYMKKIANMTRRRWIKLREIIENKRKGIKMAEEEEELNAEEAKKDGSIWYPTIWSKIQAKPEWKQTFEKIPLIQQPNVMKMFVEDMPKFEYIQEYHEYLDKKMEDIYNKNINILTTCSETSIIKELEDDEFQEINEDEANELLHKLNLEDLKT